MKYRKKPVVIEAVQWTGSNLEEIKQFVTKDLIYDIDDAAWKVGMGIPEVTIKIKTLEGEMLASVGDYIIKGVGGEFYPCKPDIFQKTYNCEDENKMATAKSSKEFCNHSPANKLESPFKNDPFVIAYMAFKNLYPNKECEYYWAGDVNGDDEWNGSYGMTIFDKETGEATVYIKPTISVKDAVEVFAHELAHVAAGEKHEHDSVWEEVFNAIFVEYGRIMMEMVEEQNEE